MASSTAPARREGLWEHVRGRTPLPECEEMSYLVGKRLIASNEALWTEKATLQSILYEYVNQMQRRSGRKMFKDAMSYSKSFYDVNEALSYGQQSLVIFQTQLFSIEAPKIVIDGIKEQLELENVLLDNLIQRLQAAVESAASGDMDLGKSKEMDPKALCSSKLARRLPARSGDIPTNPMRSESTPSVTFDGQSSPTSHDSPRRPNSGIGRFKSRLLDAQSELFLTDDLI